MGSFRMFVTVSWNHKLSFGYLERFLSSQLANSLLASSNCLALLQQPCKNASLKPVCLKLTSLGLCKYLPLVENYLALKLYINYLKFCIPSKKESSHCIRWTYMWNWKIFNLNYKKEDFQKVAFHICYMMSKWNPF